eukprot:gb/GECG01009187.1/.p1 GENE.gb/GECG01009187.1/~~gb/GECG01009187.1/.p1  ORF type:complete len:214 (+),score=23.28 gb/GECG01009187.1/:1-642(+)
MDEERQPLTEGDSGVDGTMRTHAHSMKRKVDFNRWPVYLKQACIALSIVAVVVFLLFPRGIESKQKPAVGAPSGQQQSLLRQGKFGEDGHGQKPSGPPSREELGASTWTLLHHMAAHFDAKPTEERQKQVADFIKLLGQLYPCDACREHFQKMVEDNPPRTESNSALSTWLCERHNEVNRRLGKDEFPCNVKSLKDRWGDCGCFPEDTTENTV